MNNTLRENFLSLIYSYKTVKEKHELYKTLSDSQSNIFETSFISNMFEQFGKIETDRPVKEILDEMKASYLKKWEDLLIKIKVEPNPNQRQAITATLDFIAISTELNCFKMRKHIPRLGEDASVENQKEKEKEKELEQELLNLDAKRVAFPHKRIHIDIESLMGIDCNLRGMNVKLNEMLNQSPKPPGYAFDDNIFVSENYVNTFVNQADKMDKFRKPINLYMVLQEPLPSSKFKTVIITQEEAEEIEALFKRDPLNNHKGRLWILSPNDTLWMGSTPTIEHPGFNRIREQIRFLNGDIQLLAKNLGQVDWLTVDTKAKMEYLQTVVFANFPEKRRETKTLLHSFEYRKLHQQLMKAIHENNEVAFLEVLKNVEKLPNLRIRRIILNAKNVDGNTPYTLAIQSKATGILKEIIKNTHMKPCIKEAGVKAQALACKADPEIFRLLNASSETAFDLKNDGLWIELLGTLVLSGDIKAVQFLLGEIEKLPKETQKIVLNQVSNNGLSLPLAALKLGNSEMAALLLNQPMMVYAEDTLSFLNIQLINCLKVKDIDNFEKLIKFIQTFPLEFQSKLLNLPQKIEIKTKSLLSGYGDDRFRNRAGHEVTSIEVYEGSLVYLAFDLGLANFQNLLLPLQSVELGANTQIKIEKFCSMIESLMISKPELIREILLRKETFPESKDTPGWILFFQKTLHLSAESMEIIVQQAKTIIDEKVKAEIFNGLFDTIKVSNNFYNIATALGEEFNSNTDSLMKLIEKEAWSACQSVIEHDPKFPNPDEKDKWRLLFKGVFNSGSEVMFKLVYEAFNRIADPHIKSDILNGYSSEYNNISLLSFIDSNVPTSIQEQMFKNSLFNPHVVAAATGETLLHSAVQQKNEILTDLLLQAGVNINAQDNNGFTPLMMAYQNLDVNSVKKLISTDKVDFSLKNKHEQDILSIRMLWVFATSEKIEKRALIRASIESKIKELKTKELDRKAQSDKPNEQSPESPTGP